MVSDSETNGWVKHMLSTLSARCVVLFILLLILGVDLCAADIHKCVVNGVTTYSDRPCDGQVEMIYLDAQSNEQRDSWLFSLSEWAMDAMRSALDFLSRSWYLILIVVAVLLTILRTPKIKGLFGESVVNLMAKVMLNKDDYHLIRNVTLPTGDGTTQIDHVIVSPYGVFVIETKNMKGWIFGSPNQKTWTQKIYKHTNTFQNPLHQNEKHIQALADLLRISRVKMYSVVAFVGASTFKTQMPENVTQGRGWIRFIKTKNRPVFSNEEVARMIRGIEAVRLTPSMKTNREHVQHVRKIIADKQKKS
jgi:hypothetical protein